ncbi:MAG: hypothetical protein OHK0029_02560 [Armatimonadaceae bacterium]
MRKFIPGLAGLGVLAGMALTGATPVHAQVAGFPDVPKTHWAAEAVSKVASAGIVRGYPVGQNTKATGNQQYNGDKPVTRYELAVTLYRFVLYMERADRQKKGNLKVEAPIQGAEAIKRLVMEGYLPRTTPLAQEGAKIVTANELADAMAQVIVKIRSKQTPITPESRRTMPIEKPGSTRTDTDT